MEIKVPDYYNVRNHVKDKDGISEGVNTMFCMIDELTGEAYKEGYETGYKDGVAYVEGGASND